MPPNNGALDPDAVNLAKAIRQTESGGNFSARGKSGEYGAYQFTPDTWKHLATKYGVSVPLEQAGREEQNQVAYKQIKEWKDAGYNVGQVASMWNAGPGKPNAYLDQNEKGTNKYGAQYDVPGYAKRVADAYHTIKGQTAQPGQPGVAPQKDQNPQKTDWLAKITHVINSIFPGEQIGKAISTPIARAMTPDYAKDYVSTAGPTALQVAGDVANAGLMLAAPAVGGGATALGRIGASAALGGASGVASSLAHGETDVGKVGQAGLTGGLVGGAFAGVGEGIGAILKRLPQRIVSTYLPDVPEEDLGRVMERGLGKPSTMLTQSDDYLTYLRTELDSVLDHPEVTQVLPRAYADEVLGPVLDKMPNLEGAGGGEFGMVDLAQKLKRVIPNQAGLITKLTNEGLTPLELNQLKSALGAKTFKSVVGGFGVRAGKELANETYWTIDNFLRTKLPETGPIFDEFTKELELNGALQELAEKASAGRGITMADLVYFLSGNTVGGLPGGIAALLGQRAITSPTVNLTTAGLLSGAGNALASPALGALGRQGLVGGINAVSQ